MVLIDLFDTKADLHNYYTFNTLEAFKREIKAILKTSKESSFALYPEDFVIYFVLSFEDNGIGRYNIETNSFKVCSLKEVLTNEN